MNPYRLVTRAIRPGDEAAFPDPTEPLHRRRASGAARLAAREALTDLGGPADAALPRSPRGFPLWPAGFVGSLAHDAGLAVAAVARAGEVKALGVDVEPDQPLPEEVAEIALFGAERRGPGRAIFSAKEAVYKAIHPLDGTPLEYEDIAVDLAGGQARLRDGRTLRLVVERRLGADAPHPFPLPASGERGPPAAAPSAEGFSSPARWIVVAFAR